MSDVYIIYSKKNKRVVKRIVDLLAEQWEVWWDRNITGDFVTAIEEELPKAKCAVVLWSNQSRNSQNVREEVTLANQLGVKVVHVRLDDCSLPYGFLSNNTTEMKDWDGEPDHEDFQELIERIELIVPPENVQNSKSIGPDSARLVAPLPIIFLSVSSHETQLLPLEAVKALRVFAAPAILVSAYDLLDQRCPKGIVKQLEQYREQKGAVLLDSGNYESSRLGDVSWTPALFHSTLADIPHDFAFCFDVMEPAADAKKAVKEVLSAVERDSAFTDRPVLPIVHARSVKGKGHDTQSFPGVIYDVAKALEPQVIAIPERELGRGLIARARTVLNIRRKLNRLPFYQPLHILGTGNPWSLALLLAAGADSFDGLEWCRMVVDRQSDRLHHFQHFDFFSYQALVADSPVTLASQSSDEVDFAGKVAFHNLDYYRSFQLRIEDAVLTGGVEMLLTGLFGRDNALQIRRELPELFS